MVALFAKIYSYISHNELVSVNVFQEYDDMKEAIKSPKIVSKHG